MIRGLIFSFGLLGVFLSVLFLDQPLAQWLRENNFQNLHYYSREITNFALGEIWFGFVLVIFALTWLPPFIKKMGTHFATNLRNWSIHFFCSLLGAGILLQLAKAVIGRQRPHRSEIFDPLVFKPFTTDWYFHSLPSGHSQVMFTVACCFALYMPRLRILFFSVAAVLAMTRFIIFQHFLSDVLAGAMVGYFGALFVQDLVSNKIPKPISFKNSLELSNFLNAQTASQNLTTELQKTNAENET